MQSVCCDLRVDLIHNLYSSLLHTCTYAVQVTAQLANLDRVWLRAWEPARAQRVTVCPACRRLLDGLPCVQSGTHLSLPLNLVCVC